MKKRTTALLILVLALSLCACDLFGKKDDGTTHTITFESNGAQEAIAPITVPNGETATIPIPAKEGCVFAGWYLDAELTERYFFDYPLTEDTTLYAKFYDTILGEYIVISNVDQLVAIKDDPAAKYLLACDINCKGDTLVPIDEFTGELEGNGYKIFDFIISDAALNSGFVRANKGTIKNLELKDFVMDVSAKALAEKNYGLICGINEGTIENCDVIDGNLRVNDTLAAESGKGYSSIGGIVGKNRGNINHCTTMENISVTTNSCASANVFWDKNYTYHIIHIGGVVGTNEVGSTIDSCIAKGHIETNSSAVSEKTGKQYMQTHIYAGGITGRNYGDINNSVNMGDMKIKYTNSSANVALTTYIGNAVGINLGKLHNCYTTGNIDIIGSATTSYVGSFVGYNKLESGTTATISKCFSMGNVTVDSVPTKSGYFVGNTTGSERHCYYTDTTTITVKNIVEDNEVFENIKPTTEVGEAKAESELLSMDFQENTMYFDRMVWFLVEGKLPELR